jgi:hypothetical protein
MTICFMRPDFRIPPGSVHTIVNFPAGKKREVLHWLVVNMLEDCVLTHNNLSAQDAQGYWRWRMSLSPQDNRVLFERESDVQLFSLVWCDHM